MTRKRQAELARKLLERGWELILDVPADAMKLRDSDRDSAVRLYCTASPAVHGENARWCVQVRAPLHLANGREGRDFIIASASLSRADLVQLRRAIDDHLAVRR